MNDDQVIGTGCGPLPGSDPSSFIQDAASDIKNPAIYCFDCPYVGYAYPRDRVTKLLRSEELVRGQEKSPELPGVRPGSTGSGAGVHAPWLVARQVF